MRIALAFLAVALATSCRVGPPAVPCRGSEQFAHRVTDLAPDQRAEVWVSYQLAIEAVDGEPTAYRASEPGLYYLVTLPAGVHVLTLRLDYHAPLEDVHASEPVEMPVTLEAGAAYRLLDLNAGRQRERTLTPWLEPGAPAAEASSSLPCEASQREPSWRSLASTARLSGASSRAR
jgi:hypothetical protein